MMKKIKIFLLGVVAVLGLTACGSVEEGNKENNTKDIKETEQTTENETDEKAEKPTEDKETGEIKKPIEYVFDVGSDWKFAYSNEGYDYYYLNLSDTVYDSSTVMTFYEEKAFAGQDIEVVLESTKKMYGDLADVELKNIGKKKVVHALIEYAEPEIGSISYIDQYVVVGSKTSVIVSVYAKESKYELAKLNVEEVVGTVTVN